MLILTRYNNQRIVVIAPDKSELWIEATNEGLRLHKVFDDDFTKWEGRSNEHGRDAAMLIYGR